MTQVDDECKLDSQSQGATSAGKTSTGIEDLEERARALKYGTSELIGRLKFTSLSSFCSM